MTPDANFEISLLIGEDHYWDIVKDMVIPGQGPTAVESKLGYLISRPLQTNCVHCTDIVVNLLQTLFYTTAAERDLEKEMTRNPSCNTSRDLNHKNV